MTEWLTNIICALIFPFDMDDSTFMQRYRQYREIGREQREKGMQ